DESGAMWYAPSRCARFLRHIADAADRTDRQCAFELAAQAADIKFDRIGTRIIVEIEELRRDLVLAQHPADIAYQYFKKAELPVGQRQLGVADAHQLGVAV